MHTYNFNYTHMSTNYDDNQYKMHTYNLMPTNYDDNQYKIHTYNLNYMHMPTNYQYSSYPSYHTSQINFPFINYIIKSYIPELQSDEKIYKNINMTIFRESMIHISTKEQGSNQTYERLEYLGDAVFHMVITEYLYKRYDDENEGFLTKLRISIERGESMVELTKLLQLEAYVQLHDINANDHILEDIFEAFIGAFYLNFGIKYTRPFIISLIEQHKNLSELISNDDNYKDLLLRYFHQMKWGHPVYLDDVKKSMDGKFSSKIADPFGKVLGQGISTTKNKAEQMASKKALETLEVIVNGDIDPDWMDKIEKVEKEKYKNDKNVSSIINSKNKQIKKEDVKEILKTYDVLIPKDVNIRMKIFQEAMTHRSYLARGATKRKKNKNDVALQKKSNERLKFLGDSVIHFIIGKYLYRKYVTADEGFLTRLRCKLENRESLFGLAKKTNIGSFILVSQNIETLHGRNNINIIGGGFEAFIGALYLELGLMVTEQFVLGVIRIELNIVKIEESETNYKELILQLYNRNHWGRPEYKLFKEEGPDHCKKFTMGIYLGGKLMGLGKASSKKKAEQIASKKMYRMLFEGAQ